jgi:hypothetical protein
VWGLIDGIWLARSPQAWAKFWQRGIEKIGNGSALPKSMAGLQLLVCVWMFSQTTKK